MAMVTNHRCVPWLVAGIASTSLSLAGAVCIFGGLEHLPLANLAVPGAHNAAVNARVLNWIDCMLVDQSMTMEEQAQAGIRFFDMSLALTPDNDIQAWRGTARSPAHLSMSSLDAILDSLSFTINACMTDFFVLYVSETYCDPGFGFADNFADSFAANSADDNDCRTRIMDTLVKSATERWGGDRVVTDYLHAMAPPAIVGNVQGKVFVLTKGQVEETRCSACQTVEQQLARSADAKTGTWQMTMLSVDLYATTACGNDDFVEARQPLLSRWGVARRDAQYPTIYTVDAVALLPSSNASASYYPVTDVLLLNGRNDTQPPRPMGGLLPSSVATMTLAPVPFTMAAFPIVQQKMSQDDGHQYSPGASSFASSSQRLHIGSALGFVVFLVLCLAAVRRGRAYLRASRPGFVPLQTSDAETFEA